MPYQIKKLKDNYFQVKNLDSNKIIAKHTTKKKAEAQVRLLHAIDSIRGK
jgi:hypothetical protein